MRHDDGDRRQHGNGKGQQATGGTTTATGNMMRRHDEGDARRITTIGYFILVRLAED